MKKIWRFVGINCVTAILLGILSQNAYAGWCRAVQVTCSPEMGLLSLATVDYDTCDEHEAKDIKNMEESGIYPVSLRGDEHIATRTCKLGSGEVKVEMNSYRENGNIQGHCGAYGSILIVSLWLDEKQLLKEVPMQACRNEPIYDADKIVFSEDESQYAIQFGGNIDNDLNYYAFYRKSGESIFKDKIDLPLTRWSLVKADK